MCRKKLFIYLVIILFIFNPSSFAFENKILFKIDQEIITSMDVKNEYKYLIGSKNNISYLKNKYNFKFKTFGNKLIKEMSKSL